MAYTNTGNELPISSFISEIASFISHGRTSAGELPSHTGYNKRLFTETIQYLQRLFSIHRDCSLFTETIQYLQRLFSIHRDCSLFIETIYNRGNLQ